MKYFRGIIKNRKTSLILLLVALFFVSNYASAIWSLNDPIVPCKGTDCTKCDLFLLIKNVIDFFMFYATPVLAAFFFILAGVYLMLGGASPGMLSRGKSMFKSTFIGLLIVMLAWLITDIIIGTLAKSNVVGNGTVWYEIQCTQFPLLNPPQ